MEELMEGSPRWGVVLLFWVLASGCSGVCFLVFWFGSGWVVGTNAFWITDGRSMENVPSMMDWSKLSKFRRE